MRGGFLRELGRDVLINGIAASPMLPRPARRALLRLAGIQLSSSSVIAPRVWFGGTDVVVGSGSTINYQCFIDNSAPIGIGSNVSLGMQVSLITSGHELGPSEARAGMLTSKAINIGDGVWIGGGATILPGVTIGRGCVIAAGSMVSRDCEPDGLYAGVPARRVRDLPS